jgi:hypothetical protein
MAQFPDSGNQWRMRIPFCGKGRESGEELPDAMNVDPRAGREPPNGTHDFNVEQVWNDEEVVAFRRVPL